MLKINYTSDNTILKWDEHGSVLPGKGSHNVSLFGVTLYNRTWDNKYEDLVKAPGKSIGFSK